LNLAWGKDYLSPECYANEYVLLIYIDNKCDVL
jgi:hypothetical protein